MAQNPPRKPGQPAWKAAGGGSRKAAVRGPQYGWKPQETTAPTHWARRFKIAGLTFGGLGCAAVIFYLFYLLRPSYGPCLVLIGADPREDVLNLAAPLDAYGWHGGERLAQWSRDANGADRSRWTKLTPQLLDGAGPKSLHKADVDDFLQKLAEQKQSTLIVYLGLHGGADADDPFLFVAGGERLRVRSLLDGFARPAFKNKKIVLLFDSGRLTPDPAIGVLHSDFVRALKTLASDIEANPNLVVICASDSGERGWSAEEWGTTGFAEMVLRGLSGAATPSHGSEVMASDLFDYVQRATQSWSQATRLAAQTPIILPAPEKGGRERAGSIAVAYEIGTVSPWPTAAAFDPRPALTSHWEKCKKLEDDIPSPAVYTPRLWRRYRELLLRYEQMVRSGSEAAAEQLNKALADAEEQFQSTRGLKVGSEAPKSLGNSLPLRAALGMSSDAPVIGNLFVDLRQGKMKFDMLAAAAKEKGVPEDVLWARLYAFLLQGATEPSAKPKDLTEVATLLNQMGPPRPAEIHLLVMTHLFYQQILEPAKSPLDFDLWKQMLTVRRLAEQAALGVASASGYRPEHPYSEQLWPQLNAAVRQADSARQEGEDRWFAAPGSESGPPEQSPRPALERAAKQYREIEAKAKDYREALATRDEALADLPLLTAWVAAQRGRERDESTERLWTKVDALAAQLLDNSPSQEQLSRSTREVRDGLDQLKQDYRQECNRLAGAASGFSDATLQKVWFDIEQALSVPPVATDAKTREALIENSNKQLKKQSDTWTENPSPLEGPTKDRVTLVDTGREQAAAWTQLAIAMLGDTSKTGERPTKTSDVNYLRSEMTRLSSLGPNDWQKEVNLLGANIGGQFQLLAADGDSAADGSADIPKLDATAEYRSRFAIAFRPPGKPEPATVNRQLRWQSLFAGLALRTAREHWYDKDDSLRPYFRAAAELYLDDAQHVVREGAPEPADAALARALFGAPHLGIARRDFEATVNWTSEPHRTLTFNVTPERPEGYDGLVTLWPDMKVSDKLFIAPEGRVRRATPLAGARRDVELQSKRGDTTPGEFNLTLQGYFRGQWLGKEAATKIVLNWVPDIVVARAPPPRNAAVAVRADDKLKLGAIAIVLDFSGSMAEIPGPRDAKGDQPRNWKSPLSKNNQALEALRSVLVRLPKETPFSLRLFGQGWTGAVNNNMSNGQLAELTKDELIYPDSAHRGEGVVTWSRNDPKPLDDLIERLKGIDPVGATPLLRTMITAKDDFPKGPGSKTLLVLTDGMDNLYAPDVLKKKLLEQFDNQDITIQMVFFRAADEVKQAKEQFKDVEEKLKPRGNICEAEDKAKLIEQVELALRPKLRLENESDGTLPPGMPPGGLATNRERDRLEALRGWAVPLAPGTYKGSILQSRVPSEQRINFAKGDRMLVRLTQDQTRVKFMRDLLADDPRIKDNGRVGQLGKEWVLGLPYYHAQPFQQRLEDDLWLTATLESNRGREPAPRETLKQPRPEFVWWDVIPQDAGGNPLPQRPTAMRVEEYSHLPAPGWTIVAQGWPTDPYRKPAIVRAWVSSERPEGYPVSIETDATRLAAGDVRVEARVDGGKAQVSVSMEDWPLRQTSTPEGSFGLGTPDKASCLVVRVLHAKGKPYFVRPKADFAAEEQQFYSPSAAVTALFGPFTKNDLESKLQDGRLEMELISLEQFKAQHEPVEWKATERPTSGDWLVKPPANLDAKPPTAP